VADEHEAVPGSCRPDTARRDAALLCNPLVKRRPDGDDAARCRPAPLVQPAGDLAGSFPRELLERRAAAGRHQENTSHIAAPSDSANSATAGSSDAVAAVTVMLTWTVIPTLGCGPDQLEQVASLGQIATLEDEKRRRIAEGRDLIK
jgi:hypothetical protein